MANYFHRKKKSKYSALLFLLIFIILALVSSLVLYHRVSNALDGWNSRSWIKTPATVLKQTIENTGTGRHAKATYDILCQYRYQGKDYTTREWGYGKDKEILYEKAHSGNGFNVYVNPKIPSQAYMSQGNSIKVWFNIPFWMIVLFYSLSQIREKYQSLRSTTHRYRTSTGAPRLCKWDHYNSGLDMISGMLQNSENTCIVDNREDNEDSLHIKLNKDGTYTITTGMSPDWSIRRTSPPFGYHEIIAFLDEYENGLRLEVFAKDWQEQITSSA